MSDDKKIVDLDPPGVQQLKKACKELKNTKNKGLDKVCYSTEIFDKVLNINNVLMILMSLTDPENIFQIIASEAAERAFVYIWKIVAERLLMELVPAMVNAVILTTTFGYITRVVVLESLTLFLMELIISSINILWLIYELTQIISMAIDLWDPSGYNGQLSKKMLDIYNSKMNESFMIQFMGAYQFQTYPGEYFFSGVWPVEYTADIFILKKYPVFRSKKL